jgi:hypothetical protein
MISSDGKINIEKYLEIANRVRIFALAIRKESDTYRGVEQW